MEALKRVEQDSAAWYEQWAARTIERTQAGEALSSADVERGRRLFDGFRTDYNDYIAQLLEGRHVSAEHLIVLTNLLFDTTVMAALLAVITGVMLWWLLRQWVSRPVSALAIEAQIVSGGDLSHEVKATGSREFLQLGQAMEAMRERLVAQIAAIESGRQEVAKGRAQLEMQADELQRSNRELEQFAYVASHDLQEPLRKVASFCQLLERRYADQLDERANQYIHFAVDGARRMQQLINDLLEFSRVGRLSSSPATDVDTGACLRAALANVETARTESGTTVKIQTVMPVVPGEAPLLTQLFQNLISNAIKFRADDPPLIRIGALRRGNDWEFWCSDNGIGIPAEYADRVFLIFQRLHPKEVYEGTGIGLAMCKKIVEYHGGRIWVDFAESAGGGTTVRWTLPAEAVAVPEPEAQPRSPHNAVGVT
jgi:signal transduction histidine kinase